MLQNKNFINKLSSMKNDPFYRQLNTLVFPIMIQSFMLALVSATDAVMLGLVSQESLSSVSLAGQVQFILNLFVTGIVKIPAVYLHYKKYIWLRNITRESSPP